MTKAYVSLMLCMLLGYLSGSIHYSRYLPLLLLKKDIVTLSGDKNPGAANAFRYAGVPVGALCLFFDLAKGFVPAYISLRVLGANWSFTALALASPAFGHAFSVFYRFQGGKSIAVSFGVWIALVPISKLGILLALLLVFFSTVMVILPHSLRVMLCYSITLTLAWLAEPLLCVKIAALLLTGVIYAKHIKGYIRDERGNVSLFFLKKQVFGRNEE